MQHNKTAGSVVAALSPAGIECELRDAVIGCRGNLKIVCSGAVFARGDYVAFAGSADSCRYTGRRSYVAVQLQFVSIEITMHALARKQAPSVSVT